MGGYVYLICDPDKNTYKIGVTRNIAQKRLKRLQTGNSTELHIVHTVETKYPFRLETMLHNRFKAKLVMGEWYELTADDVNSFVQTCEALKSIIHLMEDNIYFGKNLK